MVVHRHIWHILEHSRCSVREGWTVVDWSPESSPAAGTLSSQGLVVVSFCDFFWRDLRRGVSSEPGTKPLASKKGHTSPLHHFTTSRFCETCQSDSDQTAK